MRKVNVDLRNVNIAESGISVYTNELVLRLMGYSDLRLRGTAFRRRLREPLDPEDFRRFQFPIHFSRLPAWTLFRPLPMLNLLKHPSYNFLAGDDGSDVFLFFWFQAPMFPVRGKVITCVHDIVPLRIPDATTEFYKRALANVIEKSAKILTVSEFSKQDIIDYAHIDESRIEVVYNGVDAGQFRRPCPDKERIRAKYGLPEKYILYFGTCSPRKNVESVVRAYARLPETTRREYALVVTNPTEAVKACAEACGVRPCYVSGVSAEDKRAVYQMASLMIWLSLYEGFGIPIIEAMAAGTPVVCSNTTSLPEVAGDAAALVEPKDTDGAAAAMERCLRDEPFRRTLIDRGYENARRFTWDGAARKLHDIILSV